MDEQEQTAIAALRARGLDLVLNAQERRAWQDGFNNLPAMKIYGARVDLEDPRLVRLTLPLIEPHHQGGLGGEAVNGAVISGLFDCAVGVAGLHQLPGKRTGTIELSIKLLRPAKTAPLIFYAVATKKNATLAFVECQLFCSGQLCSHCTGLVAASSTLEGTPFEEK